MKLVKTASGSAVRMTKAEWLAIGEAHVWAKSAQFEEEGEDHGTCQMCGGPLEPLGVLGKLEHLRCRNCGAQFSRKISGEKEALTQAVVKEAGRYRPLKVLVGNYLSNLALPKEQRDMLSRIEQLVLQLEADERFGDKES